MQESVKKDRYKFIGGSDMPAVMGISPFTKRFDLLMQKAQIADDTFEGNEYTRYGDIMEPKIREFLNESKGCDFKEDKRIADDIPIGRRYHADGYSETTGCVLEIKTTSKMHEEVQDYGVYLVQLLFGMEMFDSEIGWLAVYERPEDFNEEFDPRRLRLYTVKASDYEDLQKRMELAIKSFCDDLKALKENPFLQENELPSRNGIVPTAQMVETLEMKMAMFKDIEKQYKAAKEKLCEAMEKYGIKSWRTENGFLFSYVAKGKDTETEKFDSEAFAADHPKLWKKYQVKVLKKGSKSYVRVSKSKKVNNN